MIPSPLATSRMLRLFGDEPQALSSMFSSFLNHNKNTIGSVAAGVATIYGGPAAGAAVKVGANMLFNKGGGGGGGEPAPPPTSQQSDAPASGGALAVGGAIALLLVVAAMGRRR